MSEIEERRRDFLKCMAWAGTGAHNSPRTATTPRFLLRTEDVYHSSIAGV